jgi:mRNA-degrading endonuclease toxin of MazEF toxin-antitoxin module
VRSAVNCAQIATIQQSGPASRLRPPRGENAVRPIGQLDAAKMAEVDAALRFNLALG